MFLCYKNVTVAETIINGGGDVILLQQQCCFNFCSQILNAVTFFLVQVYFYRYTSLDCSVTVTKSPNWQWSMCLKTLDPLNCSTRDSIKLTFSVTEFPFCSSQVDPIFRANKLDSPPPPCPRAPRRRQLLRQKRQRGEASFSSPLFL